MQLDRYDRQILELLQQDGRISNQDLADRIALSPSACLHRLRALEESGLIRGYRALHDARKLGLSLMALITKYPRGGDKSGGSGPPGAGCKTPQG